MDEDNTTSKIIKQQKEIRESKNFVRFVANKQSELFNEAFFINEDEYKKYNIGYFFNEYIKNKNYQQGTDMISIEEFKNIYKKDN